MRIENRRSKIETVVTKEEWQQMVDQQTSSLFKIIDKEDNIRGKINIPREIQEFKLARPERIIPTIEKNSIEEPLPKIVKPTKK